MASLPSVNGKQAIAAFEKIGFSVARIRGAHHAMKRGGHRFILTVPVHGSQPLATGTLRSLIRGAGLSVDKFVELL